LTDAQRNRVESYLAIKYGITLDQSGGGQDYHDSNGGNAIWSAPDNSGYGYDIAGLARDMGSNGSDLDQRIAHSINSDAVIVMSTNTDFNSENLDGSRPQLSANNRRYLIWSNNNGSFDWTTTGAPPNAKILNRKWKTQHQGGSQRSVNIQIDASGIDLEGKTLYFVQDKDDLSKASIQKMTSDGGGKWHIENIEFTKKHELFGFVIADDPSGRADMVINELLYRQKTSGSDQIQEFVEFYVTAGGTLKDYLIHDLDNNPKSYIFPDVTVASGDYVIVHKGSGTDTSSSGIHHLYSDNQGFNFNNNGDDLALFKPASNDTTTVRGKDYFVVPVDYVAFGENAANTGAVQEPPESNEGHVKPNWTFTYGTELDGAARGRTISLTPNATDSDQAACWELTASGNASDNGCTNYLPTRQTDSTYIHSMEKNNNGMPNMTIAKTSIVLSDPVNGGSNPKRIPGATIRYCFSVINDGDGTAEDPEIKDTLTGNNRDKLTYTHPNAGKGSVVNNTDACTASDCAALTDTSSSSYNNSTKEITISLDNIPANSHQCAYIDVTIQ
jgi:hypothetical protein